LAVFSRVIGQHQGGDPLRSRQAAPCSLPHRQRGFNRGWRIGEQQCSRRWFHFRQWHFHLEAGRVADVHFSNSMVEAVNKVVKYRYLFPQKIPDGASLVEIAASAMADYNDRRPHGSLDGLTPTEAYQGIDKETMRTSEKLKAAQKERIEQNRRARCSRCSN